MRQISLVAATLVVLLCPTDAGAKEPGPARASNDFVELTGVAHIGRDAAKQVLGMDPELDMVIVAITVRPKGDTAIALTRDDFMLISRKDGQRTAAFHPSQIAGSNVLVVSSSSAGGSGAMLGQRRGPIWGGVPGTGDRPRRIGGDEDAVIAAGEARSEASIAQDARDSENPLLDVMKKKELSFDKSDETRSGLLYFLLEGKHKLKQLELLYRRQGRDAVTLDFEK